MGLNKSEFKHREKSLSLIKSILLRICIVSIALVLCISVISYYNTYNDEKERRIEELKGFVKERVRTDSEVFELAMDNLDIFADEFMKLYRSDLSVTEEEFWSIYFKDEYGATRMNPKYYNGFYTDKGEYIYGMSSFIGNNQSIEDPDFQRRLVLASRVLARLGPAFVNRFANIHVAYPENAITLFYPEEPWGLKARPDLPMNELGVIKSVNKEENPKRKAIWSGLYYDETAETWTITYMDPLDEGERHLITPAHDIYLSDLMERLIEKTDDGTYNFIIREDGYLVAHPSDPTNEQKWVGQLSLDKITIPSVIEAYEIIQEEFEGDYSEVKVVQDKRNESYLGVGQLEGPEWLFVRVLPMKLIRETAHDAARKIFLEGILILFIILFVVYNVMRYQAEKPLKQLTYAAEAIGRGQYNEVAKQTIKLPTKLKNEIGLLSIRFVEMATNIRDTQENLERIVEERTRELEKANANLMEMSLLDGLTGIHNRRSFDRSFGQVFLDAKGELGTFSILMMDIDFFKSYNDTYGHAEGDKVLKQIATAIKENIRQEDRVFRYGGEEFVAILSQAEHVYAKDVAERIRRAIEDLDISHGQSPFGCVTISGGLEEFREGYNNPEDMLKAADQKLYEAKRKGRNKIVI